VINFPRVILAGSFVTFTLLASLVPLSFAQEPPSPSTKKLLFAPTVYLQFGPAVNQGGILWLRQVEILDSSNNIIATVYDPNTVVTNYTRVIPLLQGDHIQPVFDSYFAFNRLVPQLTPKISNVSLSFSYVLNPAAIRYTTQAELSNSTTLPVLGNNSRGQYTSFLIPNTIQEGYYIANLITYFPEYNVRAMYSNMVSVVPQGNQTNATTNLPISNLTAAQK
jgi:hypothetical protein